MLLTPAAVSGAIFGVFTISGMRKVRGRHLDQRAGVGGRLDEIGDAANSRVDAASMLPLKRKSAVLYAAPLSPFGGGFITASAAAARAASLRMRPVDAEQRLLLSSSSIIRFMRWRVCGATAIDNAPRQDNGTIKRSVTHINSEGSDPRSTRLLTHPPLLTQSPLASTGSVVPSRGRRRRRATAIHHEVDVRRAAVAARALEVIIAHRFPAAV